MPRFIRHFRVSHGVLFATAFFLWAFSFLSLEAKVSSSIILTSVEGEVKALSLDEDLELSLEESSIGRTIDDNFVVTTGKSGKAVLLFSNGVLATLRSNTRMFIRKFVQESFSAKGQPPPLELSQEPSTSHLKFHHDFGDMVVKAPLARLALREPCSRW